MAKSHVVVEHPQLAARLFLTVERALLKSNLDRSGCCGSHCDSTIDGLVLFRQLLVGDAQRCETADRTAFKLRQLLSEMNRYDRLIRYADQVIRTSASDVKKLVHHAACTGWQSGHFQAPHEFSKLSFQWARQTASSQSA